MGVVSRLVDGVFKVFVGVSVCVFVGFFVGVFVGVSAIILNE